MAKSKRVEEKNILEEGNVIIDDSQDIPMVEIPKNVKEEREEKPRTVGHETKHADEPINCLRNEKVIVRFIARPSTLVSDKKHVLYGGMSESATRRFVVPRLSSTGLYVNVLTNNEKNFLEQIMGLEKDTLSIYKKKDNFWDDSNPEGIGKVILHKQDNYLDLSIPEDYIKYKILLANKNYIARSMQELEDSPKATYQFVILSEDTETKSNLSRMDATMKCYMEYGKVEDNTDVLRVVIELLEGRPIAARVKLDYLQGKVNEWIQREPRRFLSTIKDELLPAKVLIKKCVEAGLIGKKNDTYYLREDGRPLCEMNEDSTLNNAARYLSSIKRQELKYTLEAKLKN
jgi:hypothetical protein